ncbi:MAG TPA: GGDEF domain-containing protein [Roseiarcus sp.]|nr:GGDEF domain-containing protein [Roseiarcus sp.]
MKLVAALVYWPIVTIWLVVLSTIVFFYIRDPRAFGTTRLLLAVLSIDTVRNIIENIYFGLYFGGQYGFFSQTMVTVLGRPDLFILPKLLNVLSGCTVLTLLLWVWLPGAVRERQKAEQTADSLREKATHDALTGLFNRGQFLALGEAEWARARRYRRPISMLMLDIDLFKSINDTHGHDIGDRVIEQIAAIFLDRVRGTDIAGRLGGEEFGILLPETPPDAAVILAERLRLAVHDVRVAAQGKLVRVSVSIGVAGPDGLENFAALVKATDTALYEAKRSGRDRVCCSDRTVARQGENA